MSTNHIPLLNWRFVLVKKHLDEHNIPEIDEIVNARGSGEVCIRILGKKEHKRIP